MKTIKQYRQGDVLIERVERPAANLTKVEGQKTIILARGEATGHHHGFAADVVDEYRDDAGQRFFAVRGKPLKDRLRVIREWKNQVLVEHPQFGLIEFAKSDVFVEDGMAGIEGDFAVLRHEEHTAQGIPAGFYRGGVGGEVQQREYTPQEVRNVRD